MAISRESVSSFVVEDFPIAVPETDLIDLKRRLASTRWPEREPVQDWSQGVPLSAIQELCAYWEHEYDWRRCEKWLNDTGSYMAKIEGYEIHFLHVRSRHENALPILLLHGWPGSVLEFKAIIDPLVDPTTHGGSAEDAFHVVIPSMPGYGFSSKPTQTGTNHDRMGHLYGLLMEGLGYRRWVAQGGDWGADICAKMASRAPPKSLAGIHLNFLYFDARKEISRSDHVSDAEKLALSKLITWEEKEDGYFKQQATRPQTIGYSLADSPVGQAAWIYEKLYVWSQHDGNLEKVFSKDQILDNIMLYWLTNSGASSARLYWEDDDNTALPIDLPVGATVFSGEQTRAPRKWGERYYSNIIHWREDLPGGHFAAWEQPSVFLKEIRDCFRIIR